MKKIKKSSKSLSLVLALALCLSGCKSIRGLGSGIEYETASSLSAAPQTTDVSSRLQIKLSDSKSASVQLKMKWNEGIRMEYNMLLFKLAQADILPDRIVVQNLIDRQYCEISYNDIPYSSYIAIDFNVIQGILWNRIFSYGHNSPEDVLPSLRLKSGSTQNFTYTENAGDWDFMTDYYTSPARLLSTSKSGIGYSILVHYDDFRQSSAAFSEYPAQTGIKANAKGKEYAVTLQFGKLSATKEQWTAVPDLGKMKKVSIEEFVTKIKSYLE